MSAAKKAVRTRQAKAKARSNRALKAWATRRQKALNQKRSDAAHKAWDTRKAV